MVKVKAAASTKANLLGFFVFLPLLFLLLLLLLELLLRAAKM